MFAASVLFFMGRITSVGSSIVRQAVTDPCQEVAQACPEVAVGSAEDNSPPSSDLNIGMIMTLSFMRYHFPPRTDSEVLEGHLNLIPAGTIRESRDGDSG